MKGLFVTDDAWMKGMISCRLFDGSMINGGEAEAWWLLSSSKMMPAGDGFVRGSEYLITELP